MADYLTQSAFARRWGISRQYVNKLIRRGALALSNNGKLDVVFSDLAVWNRLSYKLCRCMMKRVQVRKCLPAQQMPKFLV